MLSLENPTVLVPEDFPSPAMHDELLQAAHDLVNTDSWLPSRAMIDKSAAEKNALHMGMLCSMSRYFKYLISLFFFDSLASHQYTLVPVPYCAGHQPVGEKCS